LSVHTVDDAAYSVNVKLTDAVTLRHVTHVDCSYGVFRRYGLFINNYYGRGAGPIWLNGVPCTGHELSLAECGLSSSMCGHHYDASIICSSSE